MSKISPSLITARGMCFKQRDVSLSVPMRSTHDIKLIKLEILDPSNATHMFSMIEKRDYLNFDEATGELWYKPNNLKASNPGDAFTEKIFIKLFENKSEADNVAVTLNFMDFSRINDFCERQMCFYEKITFITLEDFGENFRSKEIGKLAPKFAHRMCRDFHAEYKLLNGKNYYSDILLNLFL